MQIPYFHIHSGTCGRTATVGNGTSILTGIGCRHGCYGISGCIIRTRGIGISQTSVLTYLPQIGSISRNVRAAYGQGHALTCAEIPFVAGRDDRQARRTCTCPCGCIGLVAFGHRRCKYRAPSTEGITGLGSRRSGHCVTYSDITATRRVGTG